MACFPKPLLTCAYPTYNLVCTRIALMELLQPHDHLTNAEHWVVPSGRFLRSCQVSAIWVCMFRMPSPSTALHKNARIWREEWQRWKILLEKECPEVACPICAWVVMAKRGCARARAMCACLHMTALLAPQSQIRICLASRSAQQHGTRHGSAPSQQAAQPSS